ncbi:hypothetical protein HHK36_005890 [Tetracentron sinense]|uniref:Uncharacterized protein n=1 Tax=Tetracentron sinense TaxID=13715 RepID=A0A834ZM80_TETSI|nr:hypothetical protein HHK36_005890 [Tetracentron sinense]
MEHIESEIRRVLQDHQKISSNIRCEEAKIDELNKEMRRLEDRIRASESSESERERMQNLLSYQSTLIVRASSRTELLRVLHEDLVILFIRRKQLRQSDGAVGSTADAMPNVSISSGLSSGDDENQCFPNDCPIPGSMDIMGMGVGHENLEEVTTADQDRMPLGLKMLQINMNEDACLTPEDGSDYGDLQYKNNILDNIAMSILDPDANVDNIFKEAIGNSNFSCKESEGSKKVPKMMGRINYRSLARRLTVEFDEIGNPTGPNAGAFKRSINSYVCHFLPVRFKQIGDVPVEDYRSVLNVLTVGTLEFLQHKYKLLIQVKKDLERGTEPQKPSYLNKEDWYAFVAKTKDEEFDKISKKNKASRSQQSAHSRKGVSPTSVHKRKGQGSEQGLVNDCTWQNVNKPKRGRPKKLLPVIEDNNNGFESGRPLKDNPHLDASNQYGYWDAT